MQPIDRSNEVLIDPETSYNELLRILEDRPETAEATKLEHEAQESEAKEARLRAAFGEDYEAVVEGTRKTLKKPKRRPGAIQLRDEVPRLAMKQIGEDGLCEAFVNGYAIYDNGSRKTVIWIPDCGSATYNFTKLRDNEKQYQVEKDTVGLDVFGPAPWYIALTVAGENSIERNLDHPRSIGTMSDSGAQDEFEVKAANRWIGGTHFDNPEEAYIKKEAEEERLSVLDEDQKLIYRLYYEKGYTQKAIGKLIGTSESAVCQRMALIKQKYKGDREKFFSN